MSYIFTWATAFVVIAVVAGVVALIFLALPLSRRQLERIELVVALLTVLSLSLAILTAATPRDDYAPGVRKEVKAGVGK